MQTVSPNADFVIEGYVDPREPLRDEGPFGDRGKVRSANSEVRTNQAVNFNSTFCIRHSRHPVFHVTAITHREWVWQACCPEWQCGNLYA